MIFFIYRVKKDLAKTLCASKYCTKANFIQQDRLSSFIQTMLIKPDFLKMNNFAPSKCSDKKLYTKTCVKNKL